MEKWTVFIPEVDASVSVLEELGTAESGLGIEDGGVAEEEILGVKWDRWRGRGRRT
jgi:hypothetical protein